MQAADIIYAYGEVSHIIELLERMRKESEQVLTLFLQKQLSLEKSCMGLTLSLKTPELVEDRYTVAILRLQQKVTTESHTLMSFSLM